MQWIELSVRVDSEKLDSVAAFLGKYGHGGASVEQWQADVQGPQMSLVKVYLPHTRAYKDTRLEILQGLSRYGLRDELTERWLKPEDWLDTLKQHFGILEIGERFIIKPSWARQVLPPSTRIVIQLDPGAAFGTGLHATTRMCLLRLEKHLKKRTRVLDVGTGSGILSIAAAKLGASVILAVDIDPVAVKVAANNALENGVYRRIVIKRGTLSARRAKEYAGCFDLALANITCRAICDLAGGFLRVLKPGGILVVSGINAQGLDEVLITLALADFKLEAADQDGDWYAVTARKKQAGARRSG
jgi:ribosomal protein L11 methyltransferase